MAEQLMIVDGKEIKALEMPKDCFMVKGKWYTEKGLPAELAAYKRLFDEAKQTKPLELKKKQKSKVTLIPSNKVIDHAPIVKE